MVVLCAVYYWWVDTIRRIGEDGDVKADIWDAFYFNMITFTTLDYGDWRPLD